MYLISMFLIFSTVSGDFEEIRFRQYSPAIEVEALIHFIWIQGVLKKDFSTIEDHLNYEEPYGFRYIDVNECESRYKHFINDVLFRLDKSIPPEILDIQLEYTNLMRFYPSKVDELRNDIGAAVKWGGKYFYLHFWQVKPRKYLKLVKAQYLKVDINYHNWHHYKVAEDLTTKMIKHEDVLAPGFAYKTCDNRKVKNGTEFVAENFKNLTFHVPHAIYFYKSTSTHKFIQSEIIGSDGRKHFFEFDADTNQILKAMEHCYKEPITPELFAQILHRRFEPALQVQSTCDRIIHDIRNREILIRDISTSFEYVNLNSEILNFEEFIEEIRRPPTSSLKVRDVEERELNEEDITYVDATVQLGENSLFLKFKRMQKGRNLTLTYARFYQGSIRPQIDYAYNLAMNYIIGLGRNEHIVDFEFVYLNCQNQTIRNVEELTVFPEDAFGITDIVTFQHQNQDFIQFEITVKDRTHYFEINDSTRKFTKGMEYPC